MLGSYQMWTGHQKGIQKPVVLSVSPSKSELKMSRNESNLQFPLPTNHSISFTNTILGTDLEINYMQVLVNIFHHNWQVKFCFQVSCYQIPGKIGTRLFQHTAVGHIPEIGRNHKEKKKIILVLFQFPLECPIWHKKVLIKIT